MGLSLHALLAPKDGTNHRSHHDKDPLRYLVFVTDLLPQHAASSSNETRLSTRRVFTRSMEMSVNHELVVILEGLTPVTISPPPTALL